MRAVIQWAALLGILFLCGCGGGSSSGSGSISEISILPLSTSVRLGAMRGFSFSLRGNGSPNTGVLWSVNEAGGGTIDQNGVYTAPQTQNTYHVTVTSIADPSKKAVAQVVVTTNGIDFALDPNHRHIAVTIPNVTPLAGFVTIGGVADTGLIWNVETSGGGSIDQNGVYTPPAVPGDYIVSVTSHADPTLKDFILITVQQIGSQPAQVSLSIVPKTIPNPVAVPPVPDLHTHQQLKFGYSIQVKNSTEVGVTWAITDSAGNPINDGAVIDQNGNYIAPAQPGLYYVTVKSKADPGVTDTATIHVVP